MMIIVHGPRRAMGDTKPIFSYLMKLSYILAESTGGIGYMAYYISFFEGLELKSNLNKLKVMLEDLDPVIDAEHIEQLKVYIKMNNDFARWKHRPTDMVKKVLYYEHHFMLIYHEWIERQKKKLHNDGYSYLKNLIDGNTMGFYYLAEEMRIDKDMRSGMVSMENLLRLRFPDKEKNTNLLILHDHFLSKEIAGDIHSCQATNQEAFNLGNTYFYYVATLPNLNTFTEAELRAVRIALQEPLKPIQNMMDEWCLLCNDAEDKTDSLRYFTDHLIPVFSKLNDSLQNNDIWKFALDKNSLIPHYLFMGEITKETMLTYYTIMDLLTTERSDAMKKTFMEEGEYDRRIPMMFISKFRNPEIPSTGYKEEEMLEGMIKRKVIEV